MTFAFEIPETMFGQVTGITQTEEQESTYGDHAKFSFLKFEMTDLEGGLIPFPPSIKTPSGWPNSISGREAAADWLKRSVLASPEWANLVRKPTPGEQKETATSFKQALEWLLGKWTKWEKQPFTYKIRNEETTTMRWVVVEIYPNRDACAAAEAAFTGGVATAVAETAATAVNSKIAQAAQLWQGLASMPEPTRTATFFLSMGGETEENKALLLAVKG